MNKRQFLGLFLLGILISVCFACTQILSQQARLNENYTLPAETQAILSSLGSQELSNPPRGDVRMVVISDLNSAYGSTDYEPEVDKAIDLLPFWQPDLVLCSGDMVAGQKQSLTTEQIKAMWAGFDKHIAAPLRQAKIPYGFTMGNHDASGARGIGDKYLFGKERDLAKEYWNNPQNSPGLQFLDRDDYPFFYTFIYKDIFFMAWDGSTHIIPPEKLAWVEKTLASPQAKQAKMRILLGHLPLYGVALGRDKPGEVMENSEALRIMLEKYNVHTYISGHHHAYYPGHRGRLQLLHTGALGSGPRSIIDSQLPPRKTITVVDINFDSAELSTYTTYDMQTLELVNYQELPRFLAGHNGMILRRDIELEELNSSEQDFCQARLDRELCSF